MGARVELGDDGLTVEGPGAGNYPGIDADMSAVGELTPALAAICASASSPSRLSGIAHLRGHETDRVAALATELNRLGGDAQDGGDCLAIAPAPLRPGTVETYEDHRMAAFGAVLGLTTAGVGVRDIECTSKTLPGFARMWAGALAGGREP